MKVFAILSAVLAFVSLSKAQDEFQKVEAQALRSNSCDACISIERDIRSCAQRGGNFRDCVCQNMQQLERNQCWECSRAPNSGEISRILRNRECPAQDINGNGRWGSNNNLNNNYDNNNNNLDFNNNNNGFYNQATCAAPRTLGVSGALIAMAVMNA
jgi:type II secretory pathway component PulJ